MAKDDLTHFDAKGRARMVDVSSAARLRAGGWCFLPGLMKLRAAAAVKKAIYGALPNSPA